MFSKRLRTPHKVITHDIKRDRKNLRGVVDGEKSRRGDAHSHIQNWSPMHGGHLPHSRFRK